MMRYAGALLMLSGCCLFNPSFKEPPKPGETVEAVPPATDRFAWGDLSKAKQGEWVAYKDKDGTKLVLRVLSTQGAVRVELEHGKELTLQKVRPPDKVLESYVWKGGPRKQTLEQAPAGAGEDRSLEDPVEGSSTMTVGGRALKVQTLTRTFVDTEGLVHEQFYAFSEEVPRIVTRVGDARIDSRSRGGLVRIKTADRDLELVDFGGDAKPSVEWPE
jgi:hypothetical protein